MAALHACHLAAQVRKEKRGSPGEGPAPFYVSSYLVPRSSSRARRRASLFSTVFCVPSGMERVSASTSLATVENIGPSSEASAASQSFRRRGD